MGAIALVQLDSNQTLSNNTQTPVSWTSAVHDEANFWSSGDPTRLTVPPGVTEVIVTAYLAFPDNATGDRWVMIRHNGTTDVGSQILPPSPVADNDRVYAQTPVLKVSPGDYFDVTAWQGSGGNLDLLAANTTFASIEALGEVDIPTPRRLIKPARWSFRGPRVQDNYQLRKCLALFPLWDGGGPNAIELMRYAGAAYYGQWEVAPNWGVGRAGMCTVHDGTDTVGLDVAGTFTALSKLKPQLPLTIEVLVEPFASFPVEQGTIFCNNGSRSAYRGVVLSQNASGQFWLQIGDGTGSTSTDRRSFNTPAGTTKANTIYHVIATVRGTTDADIWVNGVAQSLTPTGSGPATIGYNTDPMRIGSAGGLSTQSTGFNGRIYMAALYNRSFTDREAALRYRDPYGILRRPLTTARTAQGSIVPPGGVSGKGSLVIIMT